MGVHRDLQCQTLTQIITAHKEGRLGAATKDNDRWVRCFYRDDKGKVCLVGSTFTETEHVQAKNLGNLVVTSLCEKLRIFSEDRWGFSVDEMRAFQRCHDFTVTKMLGGANRRDELAYDSLDLLVADLEKLLNGQEIKLPGYHYPISLAPI